MNELDWKLVSQLGANGRKAYVDLANELGVSEGTIRKRVNRLLNDGVIKIAAIPDMGKLGFSIICFMGLQVEMHNLRVVADKLAENPHVCYLAFVSGRYDLMAMIIARSPEELSKLIENEISVIPGVSRTETFINLDIIKGKEPLLETSQLITELFS